MRHEPATPPRAVHDWAAAPRSLCEVVRAGTSSEVVRKKKNLASRWSVQNHFLPQLSSGKK